MAHLGNGPSLWPNKTPAEKGLLTDAARRYHAENATLFFDSADRRGLGGEPMWAAYWLPAARLPAFRIVVAAAKMRAAL